MRRRKRRFVFFVLSLLFSTGLAYFVLSYPPSRQLSISNFQFLVVLAFFLLLFLCVFSLIGFLFNHIPRAVTYAAVVCLYLYLRLVNLAHPFFLVLLAALLITLELLFRRNR